MIDYKTEGIPDSVLERATVTTVEEARDCIKKIGFPAMIKASEGGGGKGIRKGLFLLARNSFTMLLVNDEDELEAAFRQVMGEVPGSPIFLMKVHFCKTLTVLTIVAGSILPSS